jgi:ankyrin repeat protein
VKALLERGADLTYNGGDTQKGLFMACWNEDYEAGEEIVAYLLKLRKESVRSWDDYLWSAIHYAAHFSSAKICEILIDNGCGVNWLNDDVDTPLLLCCRREDPELLKIAKLLIEKGADVTAKNCCGQTALHPACYWGNTDLAQLLIEAKADVNCVNEDLETPLLLCSTWKGPESSKIAKLLIERGADVTAKNGKGNTALHLACQYGNDDLVQLLVDAKADVNCSNNDGVLPLMFAASNPYCGDRIIPILMQAKDADVCMKSSGGMSAVDFAFYIGGGKMLKALAPFAPEGCTELSGRELRNMPSSFRDPIGSMAEGLRFGLAPEDTDFSNSVQRGDSPSVSWALLRNGEFDISNVFIALAFSNSLELWCDCVTELWQNGSARDFASGLTILHLAVTCTALSAEDKIKVVQHIMSFQINPLVLDKNNKRAIEYCTKEEVDLIRILNYYQRWKPEKKVMNWYGPYCRRRLHTFLLVENRLQLGFPWELKLMILAYVAEMEYVWVPKKI